MTRIPYATMIATVMCLIGVAIFCITMYRGASLTIIMFDQVFHFRLFWIEAVQMIFVAIGASMAGLGFMILFVGCLATGSTRYKVYRAWRSRVGGRISCAVVSVLLCWPISSIYVFGNGFMLHLSSSLWRLHTFWTSFGRWYFVFCASSHSCIPYFGECAPKISKKIHDHV